MTTWVAIRNAFLTCLTVSAIAGLTVADWYLRHAPARKAERILAAQSIAVSSESAVAAARDGRVFVLEQLEIAGIDLGQPGSSGESPLLAAIGSNQGVAIDFLLIRDSVLSNLEKSGEADGLNALEAALRDGDFGLASRLLALGAKPDVELERGTPLLLQTCREHDRETFEFLLDAGANPNLAGADGTVPLVAAVEAQDGAGVGRLLEAGADPSASGISGDPLLTEAIRRGDDDLAEQLLQAGAEPDRIGASGVTALAVAVGAGDISSVEVLLDHGADPNRTGEGLDSPLLIATRDRDVAMMNLLIRYGADARNGTLLVQTIRDLDVPALRVLLSAGASPADAGDTGKRELDRVVADGAMETARSLFEAGAVAGGKLWPALHSGHDEMVGLVLTHGASVSEPGPDRIDPLDFALGNGNDAVVAMLLGNGANPNVKNADGESWVAVAVRTGRLGTARALLDYGACIDGIACKDGHSLLGWAIARKDPELVRRLIDLGADVRAREPAPAGEAFREQFARSRTFRWHLQADSRINPLMLAAAQGDHEIARSLMDAGAKKGEYSRRYLWPVNVAAWHMDVPMMQIIYGRDPDPDNQPRKLVIDLSQQRVTLYQHGRAAYSSRVSTGKRGYRTKTGTYVISDKHRHHNSTLYGSSMPYFMRLSCGDFGLHQGYVPSYPASHGCIRVPLAGAKHLFYACEVGDIVVIQN